MDKETSHLHVELTVAEHRALKVWAAEKGCSMKALVQGLLEQALRQHAARRASLQAPEAAIDKHSAPGVGS
jgi:hypothetical protein